MKTHDWLALAFVGLWGALGTSPAMALPVLNGNTPSNQMVTIYPDNQDKNVFYLVPRRLKMASDLQGQPEFLYTDVSKSIFTLNGVIQVSMVPDFNEKELAAAKASILASNPQARFAVVPFISSKLVFDSKLAGLVESSDCNHSGGVVGSEQACTITLSSQGRRILLDSLKKRGTIYVRFQYEVAGVREDAKKGYEAAIGTWDISGAIGGVELSIHPELFLDTHGLPIEFDSIQDKKPVLSEAFQISGMDAARAASILATLSTIDQARSPLYAPRRGVLNDGIKPISGSFWYSVNDDEGCREIKFAVDNAQDVIRGMNQAAYLLTARAKGRLGQNADTRDQMEKDRKTLKELALSFDRVLPARFNQLTETERFSWDIYDFDFDFDMKSIFPFRLVPWDVQDSGVVVNKIILPDLIWTPEQAKLAPDVQVKAGFRTMESPWGGTNSTDIEISIDRPTSSLSRCLGSRPAAEVETHLRIHAHCIDDKVGMCKNEQIIEKNIVLGMRAL